MMIIILTKQKNAFKSGEWIMADDELPLIESVVCQDNPRKRVGNG